MISLTSGGSLGEFLERAAATNEARLSMVVEYAPAFNELFGPEVTQAMLDEGRLQAAMIEEVRVLSGVANLPTT